MVHHSTRAGGEGGVSNITESDWIHRPTRQRSAVQCSAAWLSCWTKSIKIKAKVLDGAVLVDMLSFFNPLSLDGWKGNDAS